MTEIYPMFLKPFLKDYVWGGRNLEKFGRQLPVKGIVAESWEISGHEDGMTVVINGAYRGKTLQDVLEFLGEDLVGWKNRWALGRNKFPLLVKLLDANQRLSVQVHPDDAYALQHEGNELGKTEMWVVLDATPDAAIIYGLNERVDVETLRQSIMCGELDKYLHKIKIHKGDHICVPSRTLHAILEGAVIVEIQQNSNTTYRVFDWNRLGSDGHPRELHVEQALDVINYDQINHMLSKPEILMKSESFTCECLCQNDYFTTERFIMTGNANFRGKCDGATLEIWGVLEGEAEIAGQVMSAIQFVLLPAALGTFDVFTSKDAVLLRTYTA